MAEYININSLSGKSDNDEARQEIQDAGVSNDEVLAADEWNNLVGAVKELQDTDPKKAVKGLRVNGASVTYPDENGIVSFATTETDFLSMRVTIDDSEDSVYNNDVILPDRNFSVRLKVAYQYHPAGNDVYDINENVSIRIETGSVSGGTVTYQPVTTLAGAVPSNSEEWTSIDLSPYLTSGYNYIRFVATGMQPYNIAGEDTYGTASVSKTWRVVNLALTPATPVNAPFSGSSVILRYFISGGINKNIDFEFGHRDSSGNFVLSLAKTEVVGEAVDESTGRQFTFNDSLVLAPGTHTVRARMYVPSGDGGTLISTPYVYTEYMMESTEDMVIVNNISSEVHNWSTVTFFNWYVHSQNPPMTVVFRLMYGASTLAEWAYSAQNETQYTLQTQLGVELEPATASCYMRIYDGTGKEIASPVPIMLYNDTTFAPVAGADFILNPALRSNDEEDWQTIVNAVDGSIVPSTWTGGFDGINDGYISVPTDIDNPSAGTVRALRVTAGKRIAFDLNFLASLAPAKATDNVTFEIDFRTMNITDEDEPIVNLCTDSSDGEIWGFRMLPTEAYLMTQNLRTRDDQNAMWAEEQRCRLTVNIVYGIRGEVEGRSAQVNYVRLFIDDKIEREMEYTLGDNFINANEDLQLIIGSDTADIDIFAIRNLNKALNTQEVMQDYKAGLSTTAEKVAFQEANDILGDDGTISWAKAKAAGYNLLGHTGKLPDYYNSAASGNKGKWTGAKLEVYIPGEPERSGTMTNLENAGQGTTAMGYAEWNQSYKTTDDSTWIASDGTETPLKGYAIAEGEPVAKKLVGKRNVASSMQGHKMGLTRAYTDVYKRVFDESAWPSQMKLQSNARIAVYERPFLFFARNADTDEYTFRGLMTFGAGKGDKPTFGFDKTKTPDMVMLEGADNNVQLANFQRPFDDSITYSPTAEAYMDGNIKSLNFGFGTTEKNAAGEEYPSSTKGINAMKGFFNFSYLHGMNVGYYEGTLEQLNNNEFYAGGSQPDQGKVYFLTSNNLMYRYDVRTNSWVGAGINGAELNARSQYIDFGGTGSVWDGLNNSDKATTLIQFRVSHFRSHAGEHFVVDDALFHSCFIKLFAGTDNRAKNTYYYTDPVTLLVRWIQDDLDTVVKTNNVGQNRKPYYVEEHDVDAQGKTYWQGEANVFYNLLETAFESEMLTMMQRMLTAMASIGGTVMGFMEEYVLQAQNYFPGIAYNETARLVYERSSIAQSVGIYTNSTPAITQSNGSQKWSEYQWLKDRIMYISSWCEYGEFQGAAGAGGALSWRGTAGSYEFKLTAAKWLYPRISLGQSNLPASASGRVRLAAGETLNYLPFSVGGSSSDSAIEIKGVDYYREIGDMNIPMSDGTFTFQGKRLQKIEINPNGTDTNRFLATGLTCNARNITSFVVRNAANVGGALDLSACTRLRTVVMEGTKNTVVTLPQSGALTSVTLPAVQSLTLSRLPNLASLSLASYDNLAALSVDQGSVGYSAEALLQQVMAAEVTLQNLTLTGVAWTGARATTVDYMADIRTTDIRGTIAIVATDAVTLEEKLLWIGQWGAVDSEENPLHITYSVITLPSISVGGDTYIWETGEYDYEAIPNGKGNDIVGVTWSVEAENFNVADYASIDEQTGRLSVSALRTGEDDIDITVSCAMLRISGETFTSTYKVGLAYRERTLGDIVYSNGSWSDRINPQYTQVGLCVNVLSYTDADTGEEKKVGLALAMGDCGSYYWGLYNNGVMANITRSDGGAVYDTPLTNATGSTGVHADSIVDAGQPVTFTIDGVSHTARYWPRHMFNTLTILKHRDDVMRNVAGTSLEEYIPSEYMATHPGTTIKQAFDACMTGLFNLGKSEGQTDANAYLKREFLYPAFSAAYAYEPTVKSGEVLAEKFKAGHWGLVTAGSLQTWSNNRTGIFSAMAAATSFSNNIPSAVHWSCCEHSATNGVGLNTSGNIYTTAVKSYAYAARAVATF